MRNNPVNQVLAIAGLYATAGNNISQFLADPATVVGTLTAFNADTNLTVTAASIATSKPKRIYFAVAVDSDNDGIVDDIFKSAGQYVGAKGILSYPIKPYMAGVSKKVTLSDLYARAGSEYGLEFNFLIGSGLQVNGFQTPTKSFVVKVPADAPCPSTDGMDCNPYLLQYLFAKQINKDKSKLLKADIAAFRTDGTTALTSTDFAGIDANGNLDPAEYDDFVAAVDAATTGNLVNAVLKLVLTGLPEKVASFVGINPKYNYLRQMNFTLSTSGAFAEKVPTKVESPVIYEEGAGYDIVQAEYIARGWYDGELYRQFADGLTVPTHYTASPTGKYDVLTLLYDLVSESGFQHYINNVETVFAIPTATDTTGAKAILAREADLPTSGVKVGDKYVVKARTSDGSYAIATATATTPTWSWTALSANTTGIKALIDAFVANA
ncbi:hypothetical protein FACS1894195_1440 [Bacteroidia bacterium]|nr:hypothetical protein FACS1894195_1440 [Bacteroidia bacterium]